MKPLYVVIIVALVSGAAFFGGMKYQETKVSGSNAFRQFQNGGGQRNRPGEQGGQQNGQGRFGGAGRPVIGEIISRDATSITVKLQDGSTKIVIVPQSVTVSKSETGSAGDLQTGVTVGVFGSDNADGSVTAQNIQLNPMFRGMGNR